MTQAERFDRAVERILGRSHATLVGRAWDVSTAGSRQEFKEWLRRWVLAIEEESG